MPLLSLKKELLPVLLLIREKEPLNSIAPAKNEKGACSWSALLFAGLRNALHILYITIY
jgi:hypothetical protein